MKSASRVVCRIGVVVLAFAVLRLDASVVSPAATAPSAAALLALAEQTWPVDHHRFRDVLQQLHQHDARLTAKQQWHLRLLGAISFWLEGNYGKAEPILRDIIDHSGQQSLSVRATAILIQSKFVGRHYVEAYALANTLMATLPDIADSTARMAGMAQVVQMLNQTAVGQSELALRYARKMKASFPSARGQCLADVLEAQSLRASGKLASTSPKYQQAINACLAANQPLYAASLRLDLASTMITEGRPTQAIAYLHRIAPEIEKSDFGPYLASLKLTLAQAHMSLGDSAKARKLALASTSVDGAKSTPWIRQAAYDVLYKAEKQDGRAAAALAYYEKYVVLDQAAMADGKARALAYQMVKQQLQNKKTRLDVLVKKNRILQLRQQLASQAQETSRLTIALLLAIVSLTALSMLWLRRSQLRFRKMARHDGLTGALNREHFLTKAEHVLRRLHRTKVGACLVVLDLDHFKRVNDTYGHAMGDEVLRQTVACCRRELREADLFGRLGGEEFGILMPACSPRQGIEIATRIQSALAATPMVLNPQTTAMVSASLGLASSADSGRSLRQLLIDADTALYRAKDEGRNRLAVSAAADAAQSPPTATTAACST